MIKPGIYANYVCSYLWQQSSTFQYISKVFPVPFQIAKLTITRSKIQSSEIAAILLYIWVRASWQEISHLDWLKRATLLKIQCDDHTH